MESIASLAFTIYPYSLAAIGLCSLQGRKIFSRNWLCSDFRKDSQHHEVVRIADELVAKRIQTPVEMIEDNIGQEGRNYPALRHSLARGQHPTILHHAGLKDLPDETEDTPIGDLRRCQIQNERMRDIAPPLRKPDPLVLRKTDPPSAHPGVGSSE